MSAQSDPIKRRALYWSRTNRFLSESLGEHSQAEALQRFFVALEAKFNNVHAALLIFGFDISGYDYLCMQKPQLTSKNCYFSKN
jgi:hypothetical protein